MLEQCTATSRSLLSLSQVLELSPNAWEPKRLLGILYSRYLCDKCLAISALLYLRLVIYIQLTASVAKELIKSCFVESQNTVNNSTDQFVAQNREAESGGRTPVAQAGLS